MSKLETSQLDKPANSHRPSNHLVIGQGDIGLAVTNQLAHQGHQVTGLARGDSQHYHRHENANYIQADALTLTASQLDSFSHITIIVAPDTYDAKAYKNTYYAIAAHIASFAKQLSNLQRVVFISSTGVYGQNNGEWIDAYTPISTKPKRSGSVYILEGEQVLQQAYADRAIIIRPSGIYGKNRLMRVRKAQEENKEAMPKYAWSNRIMDSDLVNIIVQVMSISDTKMLKPVYLATDFAPVTSYELTCWLSEQLGTSLPKVKEAASASTNASGKRLHSNIPLAWLQYPDWQTGYQDIIQHIE